MAKNARVSTRTTQAPSADEPAPGFDGLPSIRLDVLQALMSRQGELVCERLFGLRLSECRVLGVVGFLAPVTLTQTSIEIGLDKGQTSRLVAGMEAAGLLQRHASAADQRSVLLTLTPAGRDLHDRVARLAAERNREWLSALSAGDCAVFLRCLDTLTSQTRRMLDAEALASNVAPRLALHQQAGRHRAEPQPLLVERQLLLQWRDQLSQLLGDGPQGLSAPPQKAAKPG